MSAVSSQLPPLDLPAGSPVGLEDGGGSPQKPFYDLTVRLLGHVRDHDLPALAALCDDDFGIVEITTTGGSLVIRDRAGWEAWFGGLFAQLDAMQARTWSEVTGYEAVVSGDMGYSVVDFHQMLVTEEESLRFTVIATIIWKRVDGGWRESRYHSSLLGVEPV
ncbi:MAG TPA: nuclear transport factor 2 family protein [Dermatophilaceae bacterium]|nr:nuclear transport factor 2 family protein [Dermatophilaceae bacterium]